MYFFHIVVVDIVRNINNLPAKKKKHINNIILTKFIHHLFWDGWGNKFCVTYVKLYLNMTHHFFW